MPLLLSQDDLRPLLTDFDAIEDAFGAIEEVYREYHRGENRPIDTIGLPVTGAQRALRICPGVSGSGVSLRTYPVAGRDEFPDSSINVLFDPANGRLLAVMAGDDINLFRTAVPGAVAARYLASPDPETMAILGSGRQARGFLPAMKHALPTLERARVYSPNRERREGYVREMANVADLDLQAVEYPRQAVQDADVIVVVSSSDAAVLEADWVKPGACVISISGGQLPPDLITRSRLTVSARDEVVGAKKREPYTTMLAAGGWSADQVAEIGEIISGEVPGRESDDQIIIHEMPGLSFWDAAILGWAYDWAVRNRVGMSFNLSAVTI